MNNVQQLQLRSSIAILNKYSKELVNYEKEYHKIYKKLKKEKYTTKHVHELENKYLQGKRPKREKFNKTLKKLSDQFYKDLREFIQWKIKVFSILDEIAIEDDKNEYEDLKHIDEIIRESLRDEMPFYGEERLNIFRKFVIEFIKQIKIEAKLSALNAKRAEYDTPPKGISFFKKRKKETALAKQIKRIISRKLPKEEKNIKTIKKILLEEVRNGTLKQDFLTIFQELLTHEENTIIKETIIKQDLCELIKKHIDDVNTIMNHIKEFSAIARKYSQIGQEYQEDIRTFNETGKLADKFVKNEYRNEGFVYKLALNEDSDLQILLRRMEETTEKIKQNKNIYYKPA